MQIIIDDNQINHLDLLEVFQNHNRSYDKNIVDVLITRLREAKYTRNLIAAILANIAFESNFNPKATNGKCFGLMQWSANQMKSGNFIFGDLESQIEYIIKDLRFNGWPQVRINTKTKQKIKDTNNGWNPKYQGMFEKATSAKEASYALSLGYERHTLTINSNAKKRGWLAEDIVELLPEDVYDFNEHSFIIEKGLSVVDNE